MCVSVCAPHLAGLQHVDLFFIHRVLVLLQETFTLVFHLLGKHNTACVTKTVRAIHCDLSRSFITNEKLRFTHSPFHLRIPDHIPANNRTQRNLCINADVYGAFIKGKVFTVAHVQSKLLMQVSLNTSTSIFANVWSEMFPRIPF